MFCVNRNGCSHSGNLKFPSVRKAVTYSDLDYRKVWYRLKRGYSLYNEILIFKRSYH